MRPTIRQTRVTTEPNPGLDVASDGVTVILKGGPANGTPVTNINQVAYTYDDYKADLKPRARTPIRPARPSVASWSPADRRLHEPWSTGHRHVAHRGIGCFFLLQQVEQKGNENFVYGAVPRSSAPLAARPARTGPATRLGNLQDRAAQRPGEPRLMKHSTIAA